MDKIDAVRMRIIKSLGFDETSMNAEQDKQVEALVKRSLDETVAYMVDEQDMHQLLAIAYMLDAPVRMADVETQVRKDAARLIRSTYRRAKPATLHDLSSIIDALEDRDNSKKDNG